VDDPDLVAGRQESLVAARDTGMDVSPQEETGGKVAVGD